MSAHASGPFAVLRTRHFRLTFTGFERQGLASVQDLQQTFDLRTLELVLRNAWCPVGSCTDNGPRLQGMFRGSETFRLIWVSTAIASGRDSLDSQHDASTNMRRRQTYASPSLARLRRRVNQVALAGPKGSALQPAQLVPDLRSQTATE